MDKKFVVIDLETTGHFPAEQDKIIEVGIVVIQNNEITDEFSTFFNPNMPIPSFITNLTGITDHDVQDAPMFEEKAQEIINLFDNSYLIAHNVPFDLGFLNEELASNGYRQLNNPVIDTVELSRMLYPKAPSYKLGQLAEHLQIMHNDPHRALSDAYVTAKLFLKLKQKINTLPYETVSHLLKLEKKLKSDIYTMLYEQQQELAFSVYEGDNIDTYRGLAFKSTEETKPVKKDIDTAFGNFLDEIYENDGTMQQQMLNYEKREGQREMSETVYDAFRMKNHALIEAETGTGKTLAYLIPAIYEAVSEKKRIIISTYTTQLQSQLMDEEIPLIHNLVPFPFKIALLKGKQHYISLEKFERALSSEQADNYDITLTKAMILVWLTETITGDIDEIQLPSSGYLFYRKVSTDTEGSIDPTNPWFSRSYYQKARKKAQQADILITNHALLCTDMFNEYQLLPSYDKAIIDEAHHLEETASKHYGLKLDYVHVQYTLTQIGDTKDGNWLGKLLTNYPIKDENFSVDEWENFYNKAKYEVDDLFRMLFQYVIEQKQKEKSLSDIGRIQYRFDEVEKNSAQWNVIIEMSTRLTFYLRDLIHLLSQLKQSLLKEKDIDKNHLEELTRIMEAIQTIIDSLEQLFLTDEGIANVKWMEIEAYGAKNAVYLYSEPTDMSALLSEDFFNQKQSIILTSATLTMKNSFSFIMNRLGLESDHTLTTKINSPFSYENQVQLMIPNDFPDIKHGNLDDFIYSTCEAILSLAQITNGRMLVLFTSYDMLRKSYNLLRETIDINKYMLIAQGISSGSRSRLKKNFQTFDESILLGTSSFWEGVDIPGDDLSCLMIVRLPFQPPNHPVYEAKSNHFKKEGKNAFFELALPNAVIRFKQGFGRLIRSSNDRGIVFVCDARIIKARYGKYFTESIPSVPTTYESTQALMDKAMDWF
ncbi:ATP-dependent DNA helicase DinG [Virgibacillus subterraneus]|uniref:3'-5' exonuclease DinG n=1 Tax=Virgibacillus subterraneus TaxID=621109 RepID=A0A1H9ELP6_9BACI|nr:ATP-dependent DNA helicase DinG [Virgibacillus subterraneus]SEQ26634.1 ATP-dependent DNA helicase DinG [Virgibacillus subterraneus]